MDNCMFVTDHTIAKPYNKASNIRKLYENMNSLQAEKGSEVVKNFGKIVEYEIFDGNQLNTIVMDFKNSYNE